MAVEAKGISNGNAQRIWDKLVIIAEGKVIWLKLAKEVNSRNQLGNIRHHHPVGLKHSGNQNQSKSDLVQRLRNHPEGSLWHRNMRIRMKSNIMKNKPTTIRHIIKHTRSRHKHQHQTTS